MLNVPAQKRQRGLRKHQIWPCKYPIWITNTPICLGKHGIYCRRPSKSHRVTNAKWWWWWSFISSLLMLPFQLRCTYVLLPSICVNVFSFHVARNHCSPIRYNFKIPPKFQLQNLEQTLKPYPQGQNKNLTLWPKFTFQICTKLLSTRFSSSTSTTVTTSTSFELPSSHARVTSIKFTKQEWVSQWVSESVTDKHSQWSDSGPIKSSS